MRKPWSESSTAHSHGYDFDECDNNKDLPHHEKFSQWVYENFSENQISIFDIGCGPAWVLNSFPSFTKYVGVDLNPVCVQTAVDNYKNSKTSFYVADIEESVDGKMFEEGTNCNICYIDSVFRMFESPKKVLEDILLPNFDFIYLNRTHVSSETKKGSHQWGGMSQPSTLWTLSKSFFETILQHYPHTLEVTATAIIISHA